MEEDTLATKKQSKPGAKSRKAKSPPAKRTASKAPAPRFAEDRFPRHNTESFRERNPRTLNRDEVRQRKVRGKD